MIDVKEVRDPMEEANAATAQVRKDLREKLAMNRKYGMLATDAFRDPAEMVTISADRFEELIRKTEIQRQDLFYYEEKLSRAYDFINTVALEWAERGQQIPTYEDMFRMSEILSWVEPPDIRRTRERVAAEKAKAKREKEGANNAEATD